MLAGRKGEPLRKEFAERHTFARILKAAEITNDEITFHSLRHSCATLMLADQPFGVVQKQLGHAKASTTLDTYGHLKPGAMRQAQASLDRALGGA